MTFTAVLVLAVAAVMLFQNKLREALGPHQEVLTDLVEPEDEEEPDVAAAASDSSRFELVYHQKQRISYRTCFSDLNEDHLAAAHKYGLDSIPDTCNDATCAALGLVKISTTDNYTVAPLRHSSPYLTFGASRELGGIASAFRDSLASKGFPRYKLIVTSVLRTEADIRKLRRHNSNASSESAHSYGTTWDISYTRYEKCDDCPEYMQPYELTKILAEVLKAEKEQGHCLIKYEKKQHCFHITASIR